MRNVVVVLVSLAVSALVAGFCVSAIRASHEAEARQHAMPSDAVPPRPDGPWRTVPAYELDDVWPF
jgi:hypothetical protein